MLTEKQRLIATNTLFVVEAPEVHLVALNILTELVI